MDNFTREELQELRSRADCLAANSSLGTYWRIAYLELAAAADRLDAMMARDDQTRDMLAVRRPVWPSPP